MLSFASRYRGLAQTASGRRLQDEATSNQTQEHEDLSEVQDPRGRLPRPQSAQTEVNTAPLIAHNRVHTPVDWQVP